MAEVLQKRKEDAVIREEEPTWCIYWQIYPIAKQFFTDNGHLKVTRKNCPGGFALDRWLVRIRSRYWGEYGEPLSAEEILALENIGMIWDPKGKRKKIRRNMVIDDIPAGEIIHTERKRYKLGRMNPEEITEWTAAGVIG